ncbi:aminotransferase class IV [Acetobacter fallax]|uniref:Probable branched-chain-amino-acid aminotransferase n=1 Tax=Acetobacter fallax TaxID=1737473 RepID=A0ABX0KGB8_9PROT|nr:aminotransferase class IV [Acetobacter fallax]NHO33465.1 aminotransferase class IV [Acetobacter fallax]NHO37055.1 aminotransferase class IV [Acetobacter fallax]
MSLVWLNGRLLPVSEARIDPSDRGFLLGDGLFETMWLVDGVVPRLERHLSRLADGCSVLMLSCPEPGVLRGAIADLVDALRVRNGSLRLTVTRGCGPRGVMPPGDVRPTVLLTWAPPVSGGAARTIRLGVSRYVRDGASPLARVKSLNYLPSVMTRMEAAAAGFDDALLPGVGGVVAEASAANVVFLLDGMVVTPPVADGALPGTSRGRLLETGFCFEGSVPLGRLKDVRAAWLVSALSVVPVGAIGGRALAGDAGLEMVIRALLFG